MGNPDIQTLDEISSVRVPTSATRKRRIRHELSRHDSETAELFPNLVGERAARDLPPHFPNSPEGASNFPDEYHGSDMTYPAQPAKLDGAESWLAYTAQYLDRGLTVAAEPRPAYTTNVAWPAQPIPGTEQQTPFEEDQTWMLARIPHQKHELFHPDQHLQDQPQTNNELVAESVERTAP